MTIHQDVPGIEVTVQINGTDAIEYAIGDATNEDAICPTVTKYIECVDDGSFRVRVLVDGNYDWGYKNHTLKYELYVDGTYVGAYVVGFNKLVRSITGNLQREIVIKDIKEFDEAHGEWVCQNFKFSSVKTLDDVQPERLENDRKIAKDLGLIELNVYRGIDHGEQVPRASRANMYHSSFELAEKSLKGKSVSHGTSYGVAKATHTPNFRKFQWLEEDNGPIAIYRFLYRSLEALKRELIIPRTPPPSSPTLSALPEVERDRLARERLEQLKFSRAKEEGGRPVKQESGVVYDLTQNDAPGSIGNISKSIEIVDLTEAN